LKTKKIVCVDMSTVVSVSLQENKGRQSAQPTPQPTATTTTAATATATAATTKTAAATTTATAAATTTATTTKATTTTATTTTAKSKGVRVVLGLEDGVRMPITDAYFTESAVMKKIMKEIQQFVGVEEDDDDNDEDEHTKRD